MKNRFNIVTMRIIPDFKDYYACKDGRIYRYIKGRYKQVREYRLPYSKYLSVYLCDKNDKKGVFVHNLVASAFRKINPDNYYIYHKDKNLMNNKPDNLTVHKKPYIPKINEKNIFLKNEIKDFEAILLNFVRYNKEDPLWKEYYSTKIGKSLKVRYNWLKILLKSNDMI